MSYQCLGKGKYKITAKIYRDCRGISFSGPSFGVFAGTNGGNGCGSSGLSISRTGIKDVTPRCSTASSPCSPQNTYGTGEGIEEHTYEVTVDFNASPLSGYVNKSTCCEVTFYIGQCCRNGAITTGPSGNDFYTTCMINICNIKKTTNKCNSSPTLSNAPIGFLCCNRAYYFNNGAIDTVDYDSFSYGLTNGISGLPNSSVSYSSPFTPRYFMTPYCIPPTSITCTPNPKTNPPRGLFFDTTNGDVILTPTKCDEVAIAVITITEWRKDSASGKFIMIGRTRRDMQLIVNDDCGYNKAPTLLGPYNWVVCEGDTLKVRVETKDETYSPYQVVPDTTTLTYNGPIPGSTFTVAQKVNWPEQRLAYADFKWCPKPGMASNIAYSFSISVTDNHCPRPATSIRGFKIRVLPKAGDLRKYRQLNCGRLEFSAHSFKDTTDKYNFKWSIFKDSVLVYYSMKQMDTFKYTTSGKYYIQHTINSKTQNCPTVYYDTVFVDPQPKIIVNDTSICFGDSVKLFGRIVNAKPKYRFYWSRIFYKEGKYDWKTELHELNDTLDYLMVNQLTKDSAFKIKVVDDNGCSFFDTVLVRVNNRPNTCDFEAKADYQFSYFGLILEPKDINNQLGGQAGVKYKWTVTGIGVKYSKDSSALVKFSLPNDGSYSITMEAEDSITGCKCVVTKIFKMDRAGREEIETSFFIYPNPVSDALTVKSEFKVYPMQYRICDIRGALITAGGIQQSGITVIPLRIVTSGVYTIEFFNANLGSDLHHGIFKRFIVVNPSE